MNKLTENSLTDMLDAVRDNADAINQWRPGDPGPTPADMAARIQEALNGVSPSGITPDRVTPLWTQTAAILTQCERLRGQIPEPQAAQDAGERILLALEALAYITGAGDWAKSNGFHKPATYAGTEESGWQRGVSLCMERDISDLTGRTYRGRIDLGAGPPLEITGNSPEAVREKARELMTEMLRSHAVELSFPSRGWTETLVLKLNENEAANLRYTA